METQTSSQIFKKKHGKIKDIVKERKSARWDDYANLKFVELCEEEISKGNKRGTYFSKDGWNNLVSGFNAITGRNYDKKQLRNHWDQMREEWSLFKDMMTGHIEITWDQTRNTIGVSEYWWDERIKQNDKFKKFRNKDLSLLWFRYDGLFKDSVVGGNKATPPSQRSGVASMKDDIDTPLNVSPLNFVSSKSTATSSYSATVAPSVEECMGLLVKTPGIQIGSPMFSYACNLLCCNNNREMFVHIPDDSARYNWIAFNYETWKSKNPEFHDLSS